MKKYLFVFTLFVALATTACDTSSKASTTQPLTTAQAPVEPQPQLQTANQPTVVSDSAMLMMRKKSEFKKKSVDMMKVSPETMKKTDN